MARPKKKSARRSQPDKTPSETRAVKRRGDRSGSASRATPSDVPSAPAVGAFPIVGIGASAGGLEAFTDLLKNLPTDSGLGFVLVQHLDPDHQSALTQLLAKATVMPVHEITNNLRVEPNHVYVIPPNTNLSIARGVLKLLPRPEARAGTRSIDFFFEALAQDQRERAIGVILSGTATDGTLGLEAIKAGDGITLVQDESAKYDSMPRSAVAAGCVDYVLSPKKIAHELARIAAHPYVRGAQPAGQHGGDDVASGQADDETPFPARGKSRGASPRPNDGSPNDAREKPALPEESAFKKILLLVRNHSGVDFSSYKISTIQRRIQRRMLLGKLDTTEAYVRSLRNNAAELSALFTDLLIGVTSFFRNPESFEYLQRHVFPRILPEGRDDPFRIWVLGCSSGQEAYSLAMAFTEFSEPLPRAPKLQIFATDINNAMLDKARHGLYPKNGVADVSPERLRRFFVEEEGGFRVIKPLREAVVFARQNLLSDPPFSRMDLISCRNLLIYLEPSLQKKVMPTFHYALKPKGCLFLGASESVGPFTELFEPLDRKHKFFARKGGASPALPPRLSPGDPLVRKITAAAPPPDVPHGFHGEINAQREADRVTRNRFAPPSVLVDARLHILEFRGDTGPYLKSPAGQASFHVLKMAREGLMLPLRTALNKAKKENKVVRRENVRVTQDEDDRRTTIEVVPLKNLKERCYLIFFEDAGMRSVGGPPVDLPKREQRAARKEEPRRIHELETELTETRDHAQSLQEQQDAATEELQASNEEVTSANEELQSLNEELETSKEELESSNEELTTVNEEMAHRNAELNRLNGDLVNLQTSTKLAVVLLGRDLTIRRFSPQAEKLFNLLGADVGRPIGNVRHTLDLTDLDVLVSEVIASVRESEREVQDKDGRFYSLRVRPYLTLDNKVDGAVLVLVDISELKRAERETRAARDYAEATIRTARDPLVVLRADLRVNTANDAFYKAFKTEPVQTEGRSFFEAAGGAWDIPKLRALLDEIVPRNSVFNDFEVTHTFPATGRRTMLLNARRLMLDDGSPAMVLLAIEDVTERKRLAEASARLAAIVESADEAIFGENLDGVVTSWNRGAERLFGYTAQEAVGRQMSILIPPDRPDEEPRILERVRRGERTDYYETIRRCKDGTLREVTLNVSPIADAQGNIVGASKIALDITKPKQAAERVRVSEIRFRRLFEAARDGVLILDAFNRKITNANPFMTELLGYTREELLGQELWQIGLLKDEAASAAAFRDLQQKGEIRYENLPLQNKSGARLEVEVVANCYEEGGAQVVQCNIRDITERKHIEESLRRNHEELARFNRAMVGRENRMIELKQEVNELCRRLGEAARYALNFEEGKP